MAIARKRQVSWLISDIITVLLVAREGRFY